MAPVIKFSMYVPLTPNLHHTKIRKNWPRSFYEEVQNVHLLTHDDGRRRKPIAIGHLFQVTKKFPRSEAYPIWGCLQDNKKILNIRHSDWSQHLSFQHPKTNPVHIQQFMIACIYGSKPLGLCFAMLRRTCHSVGWALVLQCILSYIRWRYLLYLLPIYIYQD